MEVVEVLRFQIKKEVGNLRKVLNYDYGLTGWHDQQRGIHVRNGVKVWNNVTGACNNVMMLDN